VLGLGLTTPHLKKQFLMKYYAGPRTWTEYLERCMQRKMGMRFGTWNVRFPCRTGSLTTVARKIAKYRSRMMRWTGHVTCMGRRGMHKRFWWVRQKERDQCNTRCKWVDSRKIDLQGGVLWTGFIRLRIGTIGELL
jgi:hypothetical protein